MCSQPPIDQMRRRLRFALALSAVLLASGCDESGNSSGSDSARVSSGAGASSSPATSSSSSSGSSGSSSSGSSSSGSSSSGTAGILDATWNAPTMNTDGSVLNDLAFYRVYYGTANTPCQGSSLFHVTSPTRS